MLKHNGRQVAVPLLMHTFTSLSVTFGQTSPGTHIVSPCASKNEHFVFDGQAPVQGNKSLSSSLYKSGPTDYIF